jgi:hypothetical protein
MNGFSDNGDGSESFTHEGWEVRIWPSSGCARVMSPGQFGPGGPIHQFELGFDGLWVHRASPGRGHDDHRAAAFTIPRPVIGAMFAARATVGG